MADPLTPDALDVVVGWLVAGMMKATVNTDSEREAMQFVVTGRAEQVLDAERATVPEHGLCCECFDAPNMAAGHEHWDES